MHAHAQNAKYAHLYTAQQHAHAQALMQYLQQYYNAHVMYKNARKRKLSVSINNTTSITCNLLNIAKMFNVINIKVTQTALVLQVA